MKLDYMLSGVVKGEYLEVNGVGKIDPDSGSVNLDLNVVFAPKGWDPAIIILICCDNLRFYSAKSAEKSSISELRSSLRSLQLGSFVNSMRQGVLADSKGNYVVSMKAKGFLYVNGDSIISRSVIIDGFSNLDAYGGIKQVLTPYEEKITPTIPGHAEGLSRYKVECGNGEILTGSTTYPYVFHDGASLDNDVTLEVTDAKTNSLDFLTKGVAPKISVLIREK
jgi:hypothetical protein